SEGHDMFGAGMTKIASLELPEKNAAIAPQSGGVDLALSCPARRAVSGDGALLPCAPERPEDGGAAAHEAADGSEATRLLEDVRRVGVEVIPPWEQVPGTIDRLATNRQPRGAEFGLIAKHRCRP